jgi:hypothetical protein
MYDSMYIYTWAPKTVYCLGFFYQNVYELLVSLLRVVNIAMHFGFRPSNGRSSCYVSLFYSSSWRNTKISVFADFCFLYKPIP